MVNIREKPKQTTIKHCNNRVGSNDEQLKHDMISVVMKENAKTDIVVVGLRLIYYMHK